MVTSSSAKASLSGRDPAMAAQKPAPGLPFDIDAGTLSGDHRAEAFRLMGPASNRRSLFFRETQRRTSLFR